MWHYISILKCELILQLRNPPIWVFILLVFGFFFLSSAQTIENLGIRSVSDHTVPSPTASRYGTDDIASFARNALSVAPFSSHVALYFADMMGIVFTFGLVFIGAFFWQWEQRSAPVIQVRPISSFAYVMIRIVSMNIITIVSLIVVGGLGAAWTYKIAQTYGLLFDLGSFIALTLPRIGVSMLFGLALLLCIGFLLRNGVATCIAYFSIWSFPIQQVGMVKTEASILPYWIIRFSERMSAESYLLYTARSDEILLNRVVFGVASIALLIVLAFLYDLRRRSDWSMYTYLATFIQYPLHRLTSSRPASTIVFQELKILTDIRVGVVLLLIFLVPQFVFLPAGDSTLRNYWALLISELFLPLVAVILYAPVFSKEWESGTAPIWQTRITSGIKLLLMKSAVITLYLAVLFTLYFSFLSVTYASFSWGEMIAVTVPPSLFLGFFGLTAGIISRRSSVALAVPFLWWFMEMTTKGAYTGLLYIFSRTQLPCTLSQEICILQSQTSPWLLSKLVLLIAAILFSGISVYILRKRYTIPAPATLFTKFPIRLSSYYSESKDI